MPVFVPITDAACFGCAKANSSEFTSSQIWILHRVSASADLGIEIWLNFIRSPAALAAAASLYKTFRAGAIWSLFGHSRQFERSV
jgi:hypothetical protein